MRIDNDVDVYSMVAPAGKFSVTGLLGQYDKNSPFFDGYQLFPRYQYDFDPYSTDEYPFKNIGEVTLNDDSGVLLSDGEKYELRGIVYGINIRPNGLQFTIIDDKNDGISVYKSSGNAGYTVTEGDFISVKGTMDQYNGLNEIIADEVILISQNNALVTPAIVTELNEDTESQLIKIENLTLKNPSEWTGSGESVNITVTNGNQDYLMRIDNDCDLATMAAPDYTFNLTGIGGQYDNSSPYLDGYQIFPRYATDIEPSSSVKNINDEISIYPNPAFDKVIVSVDYADIELYSLTGKKILNKQKTNSLDIGYLTSGTYLIKITTEKGVANKLIIKK